MRYFIRSIFTLNFLLPFQAKSANLLKNKKTNGKKELMH